MSDLWFTPEYIVDPFRELSGGRIDLDPASCAEANEIVRAERYYTEADNGLLLPWFGNDFVNPPFSKIAQFVAKGLLELETGKVELQLWVTNANTEVAWFKMLAGRANAICFPSTRIQFRLPGGKIKGSNRRSQALFYFGSNSSIHREVPAHRHGHADGRTRMSALAASSDACSALRSGL